MNFFIKKAHRAIGLTVVLLVIIFSTSGIILNHRNLVASVNIKRNFLPEEYRYNNWNNAAVKGTLKISSDSILAYGNIGVWLTDSRFSSYKDFNRGFENGIDNRKIFKLQRTSKTLFAATLFGLYRFNNKELEWQKIILPVKDENIVDLSEKGDSLLVLTRSNLLISTDLKHFSVVKLQAPSNYDNKVSLFKTLWVIHSGEIYGDIGKLFIDFLALVFIFLSVTGFIFFYVKKKQKRAKLDTQKKLRNSSLLKWNFKWHVKFGWITALILIVTTLTGMFLRPPLLIAIANEKVDKIPHTKLDSPNPWNDLLRRIIYIPERKLFILSTSEGFFNIDENLSKKPVASSSQAPASVMGVTVFENLGEDELLVGSFAGLYIWNITSGELFDVMKNEAYFEPQKKGPPVGDFKISGYSADFAKQFTVFEYDMGAINLYGSKTLPTMPKAVIENSPMSLWNLALETHTARIFGAIMGNFYILIIPLGGLLILFVLISGVSLKLKSLFRKKKQSSKPI